MKDYHLKMWLVSLLLGFSTVFSDATMELGEPHFGIIKEFGRVQNGIFLGKSVEGAWIDHMGGGFTQSATMGEQWSFNIGLGGMYQFPTPLPERNGATWDDLNTKFFFWGPAALEFKYTIGDPKHSLMNIVGGSFNYKVTSNNVNLGEYLFRTQAYPTFLLANGYGVTGGSSANLQGLKLNFSKGGFNADMIVFTETTLPPLYDFSLGFVGSYTTVKGLFSIGGGVNFKRLLPVDMKRTRPEKFENSYFQYDGVYYSGSSSFYAQQKNFYVDELAKLDGNSTSADSLLIQGEIDYFDKIVVFSSGNVFTEYNVPGFFEEEIDTLKNNGTNDARLDTLQKINSISFEYYSTQAVVFDIYASLDIGVAVGMNKGSFVLFGEAALLGLKNYKIFYEKRTERMPVMLGVNLPTFGLLESLSLQVEYLKSPYVNSIAGRPASAGGGVPFFPGSTTEYSDKRPYDMTEKDDWAWTLMLSRKIGDYINVNFQAGSDHLRLVGQELFYGDGQILSDATPTLASWYWAVSLGLGI